MCWDLFYEGNQLILILRKVVFTLILKFFDGKCDHFGDVRKNDEETEFFQKNMFEAFQKVSSKKLESGNYACGGLAV